MTSWVRHASSASESSGGVSSNSAAIAAVGSCRGTTCSIRSHIAFSVSTSGGLISPVPVSTCSLVVSNTIWNAAASFAEARSARDRLFNLSFAVSRSVLANSFVAMSTSAGSGRHRPPGTSDR
nr:hypothetical protein [Streptomyces sp. CB01580]